MGSHGFRLLTHGHFQPREGSIHATSAADASKDGPAGARAEERAGARGGAKERGSWSHPRTGLPLPPESEMSEN